MEKLFLKFVNDFGYYIKKDDFLSYKNSHPNNPSLFSLTDTLNNFGIENIVAEINEQDFYSLPKKFLTYFSANDIIEYIFIVDFDFSVIRYFDSNLKMQTINSGDFFKIWSGIVLAIDQNEKHSPIKPFLKGKTLDFFLFSTLFFFLLPTIFTTLYDIVFVLSIFAALYINILIFYEDIGYNNSVSEKFCFQNSKLFDCSGVIGSKFSTIYKKLKLSDLSLVFLSCTLVFFLLKINQNSLASIFIIVVIAAIFYSLTLQSFVLKKWCTLCLLLDFFLLFSAGIVFLTPAFGFEINPIFLIQFLSFCIIVLRLFYILKSKILKYLEVKFEVSTLNRFKYNPEIFNFLHQSNHIFDGLDGLNGIQIGDAHSLNSIVVFISPNCFHCNSIYLQLKRFLLKNPNSLNIRFLFNLNISNLYLENREIPIIIMALYIQNKSLGLEALEDWFEQKINKEQFLSKYKPNDLTQASEEIEKQYSWCNSNLLKYTPVRILNNRLVPKDYLTSDIFYFLGLNKIE